MPHNCDFDNLFAMFKESLNAILVALRNDNIDEAREHCIDSLRSVERIQSASIYRKA
jgi:hypothetical protein